MGTTDAIIKGVMLGLFMAISVGPTLFAVIRYSMEYSYKAGMAFVLGVSVSDILYVTLANEAATWLRALDAYRAHLALGGGAILVLAGLAGLLKKKGAVKDDVAILTITKGQYLKVWGSGFLINTINPGVIISWLTAVTATAASSVSYRFTLFGTCLVLVLSIDFLKVFLAEKIKQRLTARLVGLLQQVSSIILIVLGGLLMSGIVTGHQ